MRQGGGEVKGGALILKRKAQGLFHREITLSERGLYDLLINLGVAEDIEEARKLAPCFEGLNVEYGYEKQLRVNKEGDKYIFCNIKGWSDAGWENPH